MSKPRQVIFVALLAGCVVAGCSRSPQAKEAQFLKLGKEQAGKKDLTRAILNFKNAIRVMPNDSEPYYQLALAYLGTGDLKAAVMCLRKATELNPKHADAQLKLAQIMMRASDMAIVGEAVQRAEQVLADSPGNVEALDTLASAELQLGKPDDAEKHLEQALRTAPDSLATSIALAKLKLSRKDAAGAEEALKQSVAKAPGSAAAAVVLGGFYLSSGRKAEAEQQFRAALKIDSKYGPALMKLGAMQVDAGQMELADQTYQQVSALPEKQYQPVHAFFLFRSGKRDQALAEFEKLAKQDPEDRDARTRLIKTYLAMNRVGDAETTLTAALKRNSKDADALLDRAKIYLRNGKPAQSKADLTQVLQLRPDSADAHYVLSRVDEAAGDTSGRQQELTECLRLTPRHLAARLELANVMVAGKAAQSALNLLDEAPAEQKKTIELLVQRNWALMALRRTVELRAGIELVLKTSRLPEALLQDAAVKFEQKDFAAARTSLEEVLGKNPQELRALNLLVQSYAAQREPKVGLRKAQEYIAQAPKSAPLQQFLGQLLLTSGDPGGARQAFEAARGLDPAFMQADLWLARLDIAEGKSDAARTTLTRVIAAHPKNISAMLLLTGIEEKAGNAQGAIAQYRKILDVDQRNATALNNLAYLLTEFAHQPDEALKYAEAAKEIAPDSPAVDDTLGWIYYRKGIYLSATKHLESAASKQVTALRNYHLAMAYAKAGDRKRGQQTFEAALKLDPKLPEAQAARELLAETKTK